MENSDKLRTILRGLLNRRMYQFGGDVLNAFQVLTSQGLHTYQLLYRPPETNEEYRLVNFKGYPYPIKFRPGTPDVNTLVQNIVREEYGHLPCSIDSKFIIDGGSYIGDVAIYFLNRFKNCHVVALEPNQDSYFLAEFNLRPYLERVDLIKKGLWSRETKLGLTGSYTGSTVVDTEIEGIEIECMDVGTLVRNYSINQIDILKLDIEGAEQQVLLTNSEEWLHLTKLIIVELHGSKIKEQCTEFFEDNGFYGYEYRSLHYFVNKKMVC